MKRTLTSAAVSAAILAGLPGAAAANIQCGAREQVVDRLASTYGESRRGFGLAGNQTLMEVFASDETGSWTIIVTRPDGTTCMIASGQNFEAVRDDLPAGGIKS
ncbi:MAG: hypothetical protein NXH83_06750 [Rhodobacteraceae bacterium]|jgi:hypothetical protein|nr:hypothetical protein [Paracoccaceae bacterium]